MKSRPDLSSIVASRTVGDAKKRQLDGYAVNEQDSSPLTTYWGTQVDKTDVSIRAGERGPTIMNDFHAREKIQKFDHERIPERVGESFLAAISDSLQGVNNLYYSSCPRRWSSRNVQIAHSYSRADESWVPDGHYSRDPLFFAIQYSRRIQGQRRYGQGCTRFRVEALHARRCALSPISRVLFASATV
jgi:hypothetical protein